MKWCITIIGSLFIGSQCCSSIKEESYHLQVIVGGSIVFIRGHTVGVPLLLCGNIDNIYSDMMVAFENEQNMSLLPQ